MSEAGRTIPFAFPTRVPEGFFDEKNNLSVESTIFLREHPEYEKVEGHCQCMAAYRDDQGGFWCKKCKVEDGLSISEASKSLEKEGVVLPTAPPVTEQGDLSSLAAKLKTEMQSTAQHLADLMNAAKELGLDTTLALGPDAQGKVTVQTLSVRKEF